MLIIWVLVQLLQFLVQDFANEMFEVVLEGFLMERSDS